jgi:hypothetical protein
MKSLKRLIKWGLYLLFLVSMLLLSAEGIYRIQLFDFYKSELNYLNPGIRDAKANTVPVWMIFGDSFTADPKSYVGMLRDSLGEHFQLLNAAVPGTGMVQTEMIARRRIRQFPPDAVLFQLYVGNDLSDISHPVNWKSLSWQRNLYWAISDRFRVIAWLNYRFGQLFSGLRKGDGSLRDGKTDAAFDPLSYDGRSRILIRGNPKGLAQAIQVEGQHLSDMNVLLHKLDAAINRLPADCLVYLLVIPHCSQIGEPYAGHFREMGAEVSHSEGQERMTYPFLMKLEDCFRADRRVRIMDALPALREAEDSGVPVYFPNDPHLNLQGQQTLARLILPYLREGF